jgi:serine/threonine protein kinase
LAAEFTDKDGKVGDDAMTRAARAFECVLLSLQSAHNLGIRHGDLKVENIIMVPAASAPSNFFMRTDDGKKVVYLLDFGSAMLPGVHYVLPGGVEDYIRKLPSSKAPPQLASQRAATMVQRASTSGAKHEIDEQAPGPGPQPYSIRALHRKFACAPSSEPGVDAMPVKAYTLYGGTEGYIPPEAHSQSRPEMKGPRLLSSDFMTGDMYAFGIMVLNIFAGGLKIDRIHPRNRADKNLLCEAELRSIWHNYMRKTPRPAQQSAVPPEWELPMDFVKCILRADPCSRLTATEALRHPFLELARKRYI